jgi:hypothetical protein
METITYIEAGKLLNRSYEAIKSSVKMGILSKYVTREKRACLIKEQVLLFQGKARVSLKSLTPQELEEWKKYEDIAKSGIETDTVNTKETVEELKTTLHGFKDVIGNLGQLFVEIAKPMNKYDEASKVHL